MAERTTSSMVVLDTMPLVDIYNQERQYNRKRNAEKAAKRATSAAALDQQFGKLKNTAWDRDQQYIGGLIEDTENWMVEQYSKGGETALVENPELKREFQQKIGNIKRQNDASHAQMKMGDEMLKRSTQNLDNIDEQSLGEFNAWLELPPQERLSTPMPLIKDRNLELSEIMERDFKTEITNLVVPVGYSGRPDEEGRYNNFEGKTVNQEELDEMVGTISRNPNSQAYKTALKEVKQEINTDLVSPTILENGVEVENPKYLSAIEQRLEGKIRENIEQLLPPTYMKSSARYAPGSADKEEVQVTELTSDEDKVVTKEGTAKWEKDSKIVSSTWEDESGKKFYKTKQTMYDIGGVVYPKDKLPKGKTIDDDDVYQVTPGSYVAMDNTIKKDAKGLTQVKAKTSVPVARKGTVTSTSKPKKVTISKKYNAETGEVETVEDEIINGNMVGYYETSPEKGSVLVFQIADKDGNITDAPATDGLKKTFSNEYKEISSKSGVNYKKTSGKSSGVNW